MHCFELILWDATLGVGGFSASIWNPCPPNIMRNLGSYCAVAVIPIQKVDNGSGRPTQYSDHTSPVICSALSRNKWT